MSLVLHQRFFLIRKQEADYEKSNEYNKKSKLERVYH